MAQTQLYTKKAQIFVSEEDAAQDTYKTQAAGEAILAEISDAPFVINGENYEPTTVRGDFLSQDEVPGLASAQLSFRVPLHGSGSAGTAPEIADALMACGYRESIVAATSVTYYPFSTFDAATAAGPPATRNPFTSYSVTLLEDGVAYQIKGAFGNVVFTGEVGIPMFAEFTFTGSYQNVMLDALETATYDSAVSPAFQGASFATNFGGANTPIGTQNVVIDTGNTVTPVADINDAAGIYGARITNRKTFGSFDPEMSAFTGTDTDDDYYGIQRAGTAGTITTGAIGGTAGNIYTITVNRAVLRPIEQQQRDGIRVITVPFAVSSATTDVEGTNLDLQIVFT
jgi:hypothetical protein